MAFLTPAISHPEVVVTAVAARDPAKAAAFAKKHNIPKVKESYQGTTYTDAHPPSTQQTPF